MNELALAPLLIDNIRRLAFYGFALFVLLMLIPPTREMLFKAVGVVGGETFVRFFNVLVYAFKRIFRAHTVVFWHLFRSRKEAFLSPEDYEVGGKAKEKIRK